MSAAPEVLLNDSKRADMWSCSMLLYALFTGAPCGLFWTCMLACHGC